MSRSVGYLEDCVEWTLPLFERLTPSITLRGHSRAGERTGFEIVKSGIHLDAGLRSLALPKHIFLSHTHTDHCYGLPVMMEARYGHAKGHIYGPKESKDVLQTFFDSVVKLNECSTGAGACKLNFTGVQEGDEPFDVHGKGHCFSVRVIQCHHRVPSVGYALSRVNRKLKEEYVGLEGVEIGKLRKKGVEVMARTDEAALVFLGDTTCAVFEQSPWILTYPYVMVECTMWEKPELEAKALAKGHVHWNALRPIVQAHPTTTFILIHFSLRGGPRDIASFFRKDATQYAYSNVVLWLETGIVDLASDIGDSASVLEEQLTTTGTSNPSSCCVAPSE